MEEIDNSIKRGDILDIKGKGTAGKSVIVKIVNSEKIQSSLKQHK